MSNTDPNDVSSSPLPGVPQERRQFPRTHVKWRATILSPQPVTNVMVIEISDVGFGFVGDVAYKIGTQLSFQLSVPDPLVGHLWHTVLGQIEVMSSILTRDGFRAGVLIKSINAAHQDLLKAWVKLRLHE